MLKTLRLSLRFLVPLLVVMAGLAYMSVPLLDSLTQRWFVRDLDLRSALIARTIGEQIGELFAAGAGPRIDRLLERTSADERIYALGLCDAAGTLIHHTASFPAALDCGVRDLSRGAGFIVELPSGPLHVATSELTRTAAGPVSLVMLHDMSFAKLRSADTRKYVLMLFTVLGLAIALITIAVAHLSWRGWVAGVRAMLRGDGVIRPFNQPRPELEPLAGDLRSFLRDLQRERRVQDAAAASWGPESLRQLLHAQFSGDEVLLVSNREPYIHVRSAGGIQVQRPASGLVTALEPVMRACSGTWIAHGSGSADRESSDARGRLRVPQGDPAYTLRRIWLSREQERGYYYGFANEGLWPLCHIAHVRPVFRNDDWEQYQLVNAMFADAVVTEANTDDPVVLVQDYHLALVPRLVTQRLPRATIITFWHIPWPNPESFGICPWRDEIIDGLLGSTILGFHTRYHCNNFMQTVDRFIEARIDYESSIVSFGGNLTQVESYPISIAWPTDTETEPVEAARAAVRREMGMSAGELMGLGIDRLDYTKGILERLRAVERLLELHPGWKGRFTFVQVAAPSRSSLDEYQQFEAQVRATAAQINARFGDGAWQPVRLLIEHRDAAAVRELYRACDVCLVTSLHDGMNLVAKEFVAARDDERGVLILSQFAGASRELHEALIVNPYHIDQVAGTLDQALTMPAREQRDRMISLRQIVRDYNVYRWAGRMLTDAARLRRRERLVARIGAHQDHP